MKVGHATIVSPRTTGRRLASPNETPSGCVHVPATTSTPYLAGELTRTAPPRYLLQRLGTRQGKRISRVERQDGNRVDQGGEFTPLLVCGQIANRQVMKGLRDLRQGETVGIAKDVEKRDRFGARDVALAGDSDVAVTKLLQSRSREGKPGPSAHAPVRVGEIAQGEGDGLDDERRVGRCSPPGPEGTHTFHYRQVHLGEERDGVAGPDLIFRDRSDCFKVFVLRFDFVGGSRAGSSSCGRSCGTFEPRWSQEPP